VASVPETGNHQRPKRSRAAECRCGRAAAAGRSCPPGIQL